MAFPTVQPINPMDTIRNFADLQQQQQQMQLQRQAAQAKEREAKLQSDTRAALSQAINPDPNVAAQGQTLLRQINPNVAMDLAKVMADRQRSAQQLQTGAVKHQRENLALQDDRRKADEALRQQGTRQLEQMKNLLTTIIKKPAQERPAVIAQLGESGIDVSGFQGREVTDQDLQQSLQLVDDHLAIRKGPEKAPAPQTTLGKLHQGRNRLIKIRDMGGDSPTLGQDIDDFNRAIEKEVSPRAPLVQVGPDGKIPAEKSVRAGLQKNIALNSRFMGELHHLAKVANLANEQLSFAGTLKGWAYPKIQKAFSFEEGEVVDFLTNRQTLTAASGHVFDYVKRIVSGAAVAAREMADFKTRLPNMNMDSATFVESMRQLQEKTGRVLRIDRHLLSKGFDQGTEAYARELDKIYASGELRQVYDQDMAYDRARELGELSLSLNLPAEQQKAMIVDRLLQEGYAKTEEELYQLINGAGQRR